MKPGREATDNLTAVTFFTQLGWMAAMWSDDKLTRLSFGNRARSAAQRSVNSFDLASRSLTPAMQDLVTRLQAYAQGERDEFLDVELTWQGRTPFQRAVLQRCRHIPFGEFVSYGDLAATAGFPGAARAVGNVMASNRVPLIIPCHRVVTSGGALGGFSAPNGTRMKRRLLQLEESHRATASAQPAI